MFSSREKYLLANLDAWKHKIYMGKNWSLTDTTVQNLVL